jgi:hypothetical protein
MPGHESQPGQAYKESVPIDPEKQLRCYRHFQLDPTLKIFWLLNICVKHSAKHQFL